MSPRPLNVLWLIDHVCYDGTLHGGGRLFMNLVPRFDPRRVRVPPYFLRASPEVVKLFAAAQHSVRTLGLGKYDLRALPRIARLCNEHKIDVMHLFCYAASTFGRLIGRAKGIPTVIHDFDTQVYFPYPAYLRVMDRILARSTGKALASSAFCRDYMRDVRAVPGDRIEVLYHAIPANQLQTRAQIDRAAARRCLKIGEGVPVGDVTRLAETMMGLATDSRHLSQYSENARKAAADNTVNAVAGRMARLNESLADASASEAAVHAVGTR
jgi:hypothetical protein